jgi:hypothetical protein
VGSELVSYVDRVESRMLWKVFESKREEVTGRLEDLIVDGMIILKRILRVKDIRESMGFFWLRIWASGGILRKLFQGFAAV